MPDVFVCKGCHKPIVSGEMRRGDDWHADCYEALKGPFTPPPRQRVRRFSGLTPTQVIILEAAASSPSGSVQFGAGDRKGTRVARIDDLGRPLILAYSQPEYFLCARGLLLASNEPYVYRITAAGRAAIKR